MVGKKGRLKFSPNDKSKLVDLKFGTLKRIFLGKKYV